MRSYLLVFLLSSAACQKASQTEILDERRQEVGEIAGNEQEPRHYDDITPPTALNEPTADTKSGDEESADKDQPADENFPTPVSESHEQDKEVVEAVASEGLVGNGGETTIAPFPEGEPQEKKEVESSETNQQVDTAPTSVPFPPVTFPEPQEIGQAPSQPIEETPAPDALEVFKSFNNLTPKFSLNQDLQDNARNFTLKSKGGAPKFHNKKGFSFDGKSERLYFSSDESGDWLDENTLIAVFRPDETKQTQTILKVVVQGESQEHKDSHQDKGKKDKKDDKNDKEKKGRERKSMVWELMIVNKRVVLRTSVYQDNGRPRTVKIRSAKQNNISKYYSSALVSLHHGTFRLYLAEQLIGKAELGDLDMTPKRVQLHIGAANEAGKHKFKGHIYKVELFNVVPGFFRH